MVAGPKTDPLDGMPEFQGPLLLRSPDPGGDEAVAGKVDKVQGWNPGGERAGDGRGAAVSWPSLSLDTAADSASCCARGSLPQMALMWPCSTREQRARLVKPATCSLSIKDGVR